MHSCHGNIKLPKGGKEELTIENTSHGMCISEQFVYYCAMYELEAQEYKISAYTR